MLEFYERDEYGVYRLIKERYFFSFVVLKDNAINELKDEVFEIFMDESFVENFSDEKRCVIRDFYGYHVCFDKVGLFILIKLIGYYEDENVFIFNEEGY